MAGDGARPGGDGAPAAAADRAHPRRQRQRVRAHARAAARPGGGGTADPGRVAAGRSARSGSGWPGTATSRSAPASGLTPRSSRTRAAAGPRPAGPRRLYLRTACAGSTGTDRRRPALTLTRGQPPVNGLFMGVVTNSSPWTYLGSRPVARSARRTSAPGSTCSRCAGCARCPRLAALGHMLHGRSRPPAGGTWSAACAAEIAHVALGPPDRLPDRRRVPGRNRGGHVPVCAGRAVGCRVMRERPVPTDGEICDRSDIKFS